MGIFGTSSPLEDEIEKATSENNSREEWALIMEVCDRATAGGAPACKALVRGALRRLAHADPHVALQAATLLDAAVSNCGRPLLLEVASRDFEQEFRRVLQRAQPPLAARLRQLLKKWAEGEFRDDPQLDLIPALHQRLAREAPDAAAPPPSSAAATPSAAEVAQRDQEELERAIALSLKEAPAPAAALYPAVEASAPLRTVRALYDFEAAEENELTFLAGETLQVLDASDPNWWRGRNGRGEGLFPANFVSADLQEQPPRHKSVQFAEEAEPPAAPEAELRIDEESMDAALALLGEADPSAEGDGEGERRLRALEAHVQRMCPLIDVALERADRWHARLTQLSAELVDALNLYHELMRLVPEPAPGLAPPPHYFAQR